MPKKNHYFENNKRLWDEKTKLHIASSFYDQESFLAGRNSLGEIELPLLGDVNGKSLLHLQCHFGQDTLSLSRMGAKTTGIDLSSEAVAVASATASQLGLDARFVECNVYDTLQHVEKGSFDIVFASYGTIVWLPDLEEWAQIVAQALSPGGIFVFAEFHPAMYQLEFETFKIAYDYFSQEVPYEEEVTSTYTGQAASTMKEYFWNHSFSEVIQALMAAGLQLSYFNEYPFSPYPCFENMVEISPERWKFAALQQFNMPMVYAMTWKKG